MFLSALLFFGLLLVSFLLSHMILGIHRFEHVCTAFYVLLSLMILGIRRFEHVCYLDMDLSIISGDVIICSLRSSQSVSFFYFFIFLFPSIYGLIFYSLIHLMRPSAFVYFVDSMSLIFL